MEHRYGCREPAHARVVLFKQGLPVAVGCVVNVSHYGLFIETAYDDVQENQIIEFELLHSTANDRKRWRATLIHKDANGLGFELRDIVPELSVTEINPLSFEASSLFN